jgi:O-antigen ligase
METALRPAMSTAFAPAVCWNMNVLQRLLLGVAVLDSSIQVDAYLFYQEEWAKFGAIGGINVSIATFCLIGMYVLWLIEAGVEAGYSKRRAFYLNVPLTAYLCVATLSWFVAREKLLAVNSVVLLVQSFLLYTYVANRVKTRPEVVYVISLFAIALALQGLAMIGVRAIGHTVSVGPVSAVIGDDMRVGGTIGSPVTGGSFLALMIAPTVALLTAPVRTSLKLLAIGALGLGGIALLLTQTRGSWIAVVLSVSLLFLLCWRRGWVSARLPVACVFAGLLFAAVFHEGITNRVLGDDEGSASGRIPLFQMAWAMISDNPLTGVGINNCAVEAGPYCTRPEFRGEWFYTIHNKYLLEWVETGILGLLAFLAFLLTTIRTGWLVWLRQDRLLSPIALALAAAIGGQMIHMLVDVFISRPQVQSLWLCAAVVAATSRITEET